MPPIFTVVTPVYNRTTELRRALSSLAAQTLADFECVVVDDASTIAIEPVVREFDDRFIYVRSDRNSGCTAARVHGYRRAAGQFVAHLDSDDELFPWALERAAYHFVRVPDVDAVAGRWADEVQVAPAATAHERVIAPDDYCALDLPPIDQLGIVRREVAEEWAAADLDYFNNDFALWLMFHLRRRLLFVDEAWGHCDLSGRDRLSVAFHPRMAADTVRFVERMRPEIGLRPCVPLDRYLRTRWLTLARSRRWREALVVSEWMRERGVTRSAAVAAWLFERARRRSSS